MSSLRIGVDIGGTKANIGLLEESGTVLCQSKISVPAETGCQGVLHAVASALQALLLEARATAGDVRFCGMGIPGTVSPDGRTARKVPNLGWVDEPCAALFEELTGIPTAMVQDARAAALGEYLHGAARGRKAVVCVTLGTGIGAGIILDGRIYHGALGGAGEVGHILSRPNGRLCGCGRHGCVETYTAGRGLTLTAREHSRWVGTDITSEQLFELAGNGDSDARAILAEAVELLGAAMVSVINTLSPDALIFSGGLSGQQALYIEPLIAYIRSHAYSLSVAEELKIATAELGPDAPMIGAAWLDTQLL